MRRIRVVGEDDLCCALGERLVAEALPDWVLSGQSINTHGITKLTPNLSRYVQQALHVQPVLCIADTDRHCPVQLIRRWLPHGAHSRFLLRLAVSEAESWILADRHGTAEFFGVALKRVPASPETEPDAKRAVLQLAHQSKKRHLRQEMVSQSDRSRQGTGYNLHLRSLVTGQWQPRRAAERSGSLQRALTRLSALESEHTEN